MKIIWIICRFCRLSLLQAELVKAENYAVRPATAAEIIGRSSRGDREPSVPLSSLDGTRLLHTEIFEALQNNEADIAVHSLEGYECASFFSLMHLGIVDRDDVRDVVIFNPGVIDKIQITGRNDYCRDLFTTKERKWLLIWRKHCHNCMQKFLLKQGQFVELEGRLKQLHEGNHDATILATAGLKPLVKSRERKPGNWSIIRFGVC